MNDILVNALEIAIKAEKELIKMRDTCVDRQLIFAFFDCGDDQIIQFALTRAHLNKPELQVIKCMVDERMSQEETAEAMGYSVRHTQDIWYSASKKMLNIAWVRAYAIELTRH